MGRNSMSVVGSGKTIVGRLAVLGVFVLLSMPSQAQSELPLVDAAKNQDWVGVDSLLTSKKVDVNATQTDGATALAYAVYWDKLDTVQRMLDAGADPDKANDYGVTPLMLATENRSIEMVKALLKAGADPNIATWAGETLLMTAARTGLFEAARLFLEHGADVNVSDPRRGQTALMWAISFKHPDITQLLVENGANVNSRTIMLKEDFAPLEVEGYEGSTIKAVPMGGYTPLIFAARAGDVATAKLLVEKGADVNAVSESDGSALLMAAFQGHEDLALYFLDKGANPNVTDGNGITPLHYALRDGIKVLHGLIITDKKMWCNFGGEGFLCRPDETLNEQVRTYLTQPNVEVYPVEAKKYDTKKPLPGPNMHKLVAALLEKGADVNAPMKYPPEILRLQRNPWFTLRNATPFFLATASQDADAVAMLLERGADPLVRTEITEQLYKAQISHAAEDNLIVGTATSLMAAVGLGRRADMTNDEEASALKIAEGLIKLGADVNAATETGWTALHAAAFLGSDKLVRFLVDKGAAIDAVNGCGRTPMSLALADKTDGMLDRTLPRVDTAELLIELGAGNAPPPAPVGKCIGGRGGLEADQTQNDIVTNAIKDIVLKLEERKKNWKSDAAVRVVSKALNS
jgi:uncharacterized protein